VRDEQPTELDDQKKKIIEKKSKEEKIKKLFSKWNNQIQK